MKPKLVGTYTMEAMAVVSLCCIVAIFVVAHHNLLVDGYNSSAIRTAKEASSLVSKFFQQNPDGTLSAEALSEQGLKPAQGVQVKVPLDNKKADNWQIELWHDDGNLRYTVNKEGVKEHPK